MGNMYRSRLGASGGVQPTGNAQPADVLSGKTFSNAEGIDKTGTMVNNGAVSATVAGGQSYTIPAGYHNGSGTVSANLATFTEVETKWSTSKPNTVTTSVTGDDAHKFLFMVATTNTNITVPTDINITFNSSAVSNTQIVFGDGSAHDLYVGEFTVTGSGTLTASFGAANESDKNSWVSLIKVE